MVNDRRYQEQLLVEGKLGHLESDVRQRWAKAQASYRFMAYIRKQLVVYRIEPDGKKQVVDVLVCTDITYSASKGLKTAWESSKAHLQTPLAGSIEVGHLPVEVYPSVFLWHTFLTDLQFSPFEGVYSPAFSMMCKSLYHPAHEVVGAVYIQEKNKVNFGASK